jgi:hypothetical protein
MSLTKFVIQPAVHLHRLCGFKNTGCLTKNGPRYNLAIDDPNKKDHTGNEMALKTLQT